MEYWQIVLGLVFAIPAGMAIGVLFCHLYFRIINKTTVSLKAIFYSLFRVHLVTRPGIISRSAATLARVIKSVETSRLRLVPLSAVTPVPVKKSVEPVIENSPLPATLTGNLSEAHSPTQDPSNEQLVVLLAEFEHNRKMIRQFSGDTLVPLKTGSWDRNQQILHSLPPNLRKTLESIYVDINLVNQLVWLSSEFNRKSPSLRQQYISLSNNIAAKLDELIKVPLSHFQQMEQTVGSTVELLPQGLL